jgi:dTDP-4-amino-4,6-dideoxygalactose transaminase
MTASRHVPFNHAYTTGRELDYIVEAIEHTRLAGNGPFSARCNDWLERATGTRRALLTHSCTGALEMAVLLAGIEAGDEVIMPSFTFVSTANAVVLRGAVPVFVDIREDTLNLDEQLVEAAVTDRTKAIVPVHYAGVGCEMDELCAIAERHGLVVIEDAAQGICASYRDRPLGSFGAASALSFHETKNVMCGEGGALLVNRHDWIERAEVVHEKGTNRRRFFRGQVDKYSWVDIGSSFPLSELNAAFLWAQLQEAEAITRLRLDVWNAYHEAFADAAGVGLVRRPIVPADRVHNAHMYYLLLAPELSRDDVIRALDERGVHAVFHYVPLHLADAGVRFGRAVGTLDVTERTSEALIRLPLWAGMDEATVQHVVRAVEAVLSRSPAELRSR